MRLAIVLAASLLVLFVPTGSAGFASDCVPTSDGGAHAVDLGPVGVYYEREYTRGTANYVEIWKDTNGVAGLQPDPTYNCGQPGDSMVQSLCVSRGGCIVQI